MRTTRSREFFTGETRSFLLAAALTVGLNVASPALAATNHSFIVDLSSKKVTDLGSMDLRSSINASGQVLGSFLTMEGKEGAFITGPNGVGMIDLGTLGYSAHASDLNDAAQVVGSSDTGLNAHAFITGPNGLGMRDIGTIGIDSYATGINNAGQVVGFSDYALGRHAFITGSNGVGMKEVGNLGGDSRATAVNDLGQVVGLSAGHAFITGPDGRGTRNLGVLEVNDINNEGQVVGHASFGHAFITGPDGGGTRDLGTLGGVTSTAFGINAAGQVVGASEIADGSIHAFFTGPDGEGMADLNSLVYLPGFILTEAIAINNMSQIVAVGVIPEPEGAAMLLAGLGLVGFLVRRKEPENLG